VVETKRRLCVESHRAILFQDFARENFAEQRLPVEIDMAEINAQRLSSNTDGRFVAKFGTRDGPSRAKKKGWRLRQPSVFFHAEIRT
jgi:hypothetical protein